MGCIKTIKAFARVLKENKSIVIISLVVIGIYALSWLLINCCIESKNERGLFGDQFGAVNALFSALAFLGLIITLLMQKEELELQRDELKQTREEMVNQRSEFEMQNKTLKKQQFENSLYNMLQLQQQIVNDLEYDSKIEGYSDSTARNMWNVQIKGRELFRFSFEQLRHYYIAGNQGKCVDGMKGVLENRGLSEYSEYNTPSYFDHYFRHLYRVLKFIDTNTELSFDEKYQYIGNVRGTLSRYELVWIYYNVLANPAFVEFKRMIEEYSLLKNLNESFLALSMENNQLADKIGKQKLKTHHFSGTDYEFFLTDKKGDSDKFYVGAFFNKEEISHGLDLLKKYNQVLGH